MKKGILIGIIVVIVIIGAAILYFWTHLNSMVKAAIEKYGSQTTQTAVRVDQVKISLKKGSGEINQLTIANPKGYSIPLVFSLEETGIGIDIPSLTKEVKIIDEIHIRGPKVFVEVNQDNEINLNDLKRNLAESVPPQTPIKDTPKAKEPKMIIRRIDFSEGVLFVKILPQNKEYQLVLPPIHMTNIGGSTGATPNQIARQIIGELTRYALNEVKKKGMDWAVDEVQKQVKTRVENEAEGMLRGVLRK